MAIKHRVLAEGNSYLERRRESLLRDIDLGEKRAKNLKGREDYASKMAYKNAMQDLAKDKNELKQVEDKLASLKKRQ